MKKYFIGIAQFYITNVCNLTCNNCTTFNNRRFSGHYKFQDFQDHYTEWSKKIDLGFISILGGEPYANPDLPNWIDGLRNCWPDNKNFSICTNGTYLAKFKELSRDAIKKGLWLEINVHDPTQFDDVKNSLLETIGIFKYEEKIVPDNFHAAHFDYFVDGIKIAQLVKYYNFFNSAATEIKNRVTYFHNSDPERAHNVCPAFNCHYFVRGDLYKCFLTAVGNDLNQQFLLEDSAKNLLENYRACSPWDSDEKIEQFMGNIEKYIPQCKLCPEKLKLEPIWPLEKVKIKI
jgi:organic radical activating enzyme